jgi:ankyrin repeat protein
MYCKSLKYYTIIAIFFGSNCFAQEPLEALFAGIAERNVATVSSFLRRGLSADSADMKGNTLLQISARTGDLPMVNTLLSFKANPKLRNALGETALMLAAVEGHVEVVRRLIDAGSEINGEGWTALHYAAWKGRLDVCKLLISKGADIDVRGPNGITPVMMAVRSGDLDTVKWLVWEVADLDAQTIDGATALSWAEKFELKEISAHLRQAGAKR